MMNLHPDWDATDDSDGDEPLSMSGHAHIPIGTSTASRRPAAFLGIALVLGTGFLFFQGIHRLTGQLSPPDAQTTTTPPTVTVHIGTGGFVPKVVTLTPGQTIIWQNDQAVPHILQSSALIDTSGATLYTPPVFPGNQQQFTLSLTQAPGAYPYDSATDANLTGTVIVPGEVSSQSSSSTAVLGGVGDVSLNTFGLSAGAQAQASSSSAMLLAAAPFSSDGNTDNGMMLPPSSLGVISANSQSSVPADNPNIPQNPYTVGGALGGPLDASTALHPGAPRPLQQPASGPDIWIVVGMTIIGFVLYTRQSLLKKNS